MKKLFLLIPALVLSLAINANVININTETADALRVALYNANDGDEIVMAPGTYVESNENFIAFDGKNVLVRAEEGAEVIIQPKVPITVANGGCAHFQNVKIDASSLLELADWYEHVIYAKDAAVNNRIILEGCEIYGFALNKSLISCPSASALDALTINNSYFHNINKSCVFIENTSNAIAINITNSTFANITTDAGSYYAGVIDSRATSGSFLVDHCTFYDVQVINTDYAAIGNKNNTPSGSVVSNCIFAMPSSVDGVRAIRNIEHANNCLTFNYIKDGGGIHSSVTKNNCILNQDPLFTDAANGDFSLAGNWVSMELSPARGAATDGSDLGDPRWYSAETLPETNFAEPYDLVGAKAQITGNIWYNNTDDYLYYNDKSECGTAKWKLHIGRQSAVTAIIDMEETSASGSIFQIVILDANGEEVGKVTAPYKDDDADIEIPGMLYFPAEGDYTIKLLNNQSHSSAKLKKITLSYMGGAVQDMPGTTDIDEAWFSSNGTRADEKITFPGSTIQDGWVKWNVAFASAANYNVKVTVNSNNCKNYMVALLDADGNNAVTPLSKNDCSTTGTPVTLEMGAMSVPAGNYVLKVTNGTKDSDAELISVQFVRAGGGLIDLPGNLTFDEVILSERAWIDNDSILFTARGEEGHNSTEFAKWNVHSAGGWYSFTVNGFNANANNENGQQYTISVLSSDETTTLTTKTSAWAHPGASSYTTDPVELPEGNYVVKVQNPLHGSTGRVLSVTSAYEGGALINLPIDAIPLDEAILHGATRDNDGIHFGMADRYAEWNVAAAAGLYTFTFNVVGTNFGKYQLTIIDSESNTIYDEYKGQNGSGSVSHSSIYLDGNYTIRVANTNSGADGYITSIAATAEENVFILDENTVDDGSIAAAAGNTYKFLLKRSFTAGRYYTICIPVGSWDDELKLAFGADYELWKMSSATQSGDEISLNFELCNTESFHAGWPYLIKPSIDVQNPVFYNEKTIQNSTYNNVQSFDAADFIGSFYKTEIPAGENNLYLQNNNLYYSETNNTPIKGTRAWIRIKQSSPNNAPIRARIVLKENTATQIDLVQPNVQNTVKTIENGQLIIIKNGVRYNTMGTIIK